MFALAVFFALATIFWAVKSLRSPTSRIPGPTYSIFTSSYLKYKEFSRQRRLYIHELHQRYGPVVRLGPNEVSFATPDAVKEIYQSGGSGYDRTELYDLFKQFDTRTLFSTPPKAGHSQRKRVLADKYANTNIMTPEHLAGLEERARTFLHNCTSTIDGEVDIFVQLHCFALDGASQFLFHPNGTKSLSDQHDFEMMKELLYHDSLKREWRLSHSHTAACT
jgi:Cytochrome P450